MLTQDEAVERANEYLRVEGSGHKALADTTTRNRRFGVWIVGYLEPAEPGAPLDGGGLVVTDDGDVHELSSAPGSLEDLMVALDLSPRLDPSEVFNRDPPWVIPHEYEIGGVRWFSEAVSEMSRALHPLLAQVRREEVAEGPTPLAEGAVLPSHASSLYRPVSTSHGWTVSIPDVVDFKTEQFLLDLTDMADDLGEQSVRAFLELVSDVAEDVGNVVDASGRGFYEAFAEALETIDMSFDEEGRPTHTLVLHPDTLEELRRTPPTAEQEARIAAIVQRRLEEWRAARHRRDLS